MGGKQKKTKGRGRRKKRAKRRWTGWYRPNGGGAGEKGVKKRLGREELSIKQRSYNLLDDTSDCDRTSEITEGGTDKFIGTLIKAIHRKKDERRKENGWHCLERSV